MSHKCYICYENDLQKELIYHPKCSKKVFGSNEPPEMPYGLKDMKELARKIVQAQLVVTGVQAKISMGIEKAKDSSGRLTLIAGTYIVKPPSEKYYQLPENEDLTMHLAEVVGLETVPHALIPLASGELAYITKRVDRSPQGKVHMEDFCQLSQLATENKYKSSMEKLGKAVGAYTADFGLDLFNVYALALFCFITGNNDMHLKNFSLIKKDGRWVMSPAYDLLNVSLALPEDNEESALTIVGRKRNLTHGNFVALGKYYGLSDKQIANAFSMVIERDYVTVIEKSFLSDENKQLYNTLIQERVERLTPS